MGKRRGMYIKNVSTRPVQILMKTRMLEIPAGEIQIISAEEVRDPVLREHLQIRSVAIVRPATEAEELAYFSKGEAAETDEDQPIEDVADGL